MTKTRLQHVTCGARILTLREQGVRRIATHGRWRTRAGLALLAGVVLAWGGCVTSVTPDFDSPEPAARNAAIVLAAQDQDQSSVPNLVRMLRSDDPAARVLAIQALRSLTGQTHGYDPVGPEWERDQAIARWESAIEGGERAP